SLGSSAKPCAGQEADRPVAASTPSRPPCAGWGGGLLSRRLAQIRDDRNKADGQLAQFLRTVRHIGIEEQGIPGRQRICAAAVAIPHLPFQHVYEFDPLMLEQREDVRILRESDQ